LEVLPLRAKGFGGTLKVLVNLFPLDGGKQQGNDFAILRVLGGEIHPFDGEPSTLARVGPAGHVENFQGRRLQPSPWIPSRRRWRRRRRRIFIFIFRRRITQGVNPLLKGWISSLFPVFLSF